MPNDLYLRYHIIKGKAMMAAKSVSRNVVKTVTSDIFRFVGYILLVFVYLTLGITFYQQYEGWTVMESIFFVVQTLSTVGYGNPAPSSDSVRLFTIFFILVGIFILFAGIHDFIYNNLYLLRNYLCKSTTKQVSEDLASGDIFQFRKQLLRCIGFIALMIVVSAIFIKFNEDISWISAFYFIVETTTTVGYGDIILKYRSSKEYMTFFIVASTALITLAIKTYSATLEENRQLEEAEAKLRRLQGLRFYRAMSNFPGERMSKADAVLAILAQAGVINQAKDVDPWFQKMELIGASHPGGLSNDEFQRLVEKEADDATTQLEALRRAKSVSVLGLLQTMLFPEVNRSQHDGQEYLGLGNLHHEEHRRSDEVASSSGNKMHIVSAGAATEIELRGRSGRHNFEQSYVDEIVSPLTHTSEEKV